MKKLFSFQLILSLLFSACLKKEASSEKTLRETTQKIPENSVVETYPDSLFSGKPEYIADSFGVPVGLPDGKGYTIASPFWNLYRGGYHLGEDWSGIEGGNSDLGDTIYAIANGYVIFSEDVGLRWGGIIGIVHKVKNKIDVFSDTTIVHDTIAPANGEFRYLTSFYAHCLDLLVKKGEWVKKGTPVGTIGNCEGRWLAHLHMELRTKPDSIIFDGGYGMVPYGFINPDKFRRAYKQN
jgi:murein DD-endopeptidase MepM/ murein hydrolase activator NlpD